jgi:hypothetical protein
VKVKYTELILGVVLTAAAPEAVIGELFLLNAFGVI